MDPDSEVDVDFLPLIRTFKSGRVERLFGTAVVPPSLDPAAGVSSKDVLIDPATGASARLYLPKLDENPKKIPILIYFHGGGFCVDSAFSPTYHTFLNPFAARSHTLIVSVNYRLAPEHKLPAAYHDSWAAVSWAVSAQDPWIAEHGDTERTFIAGDSAGGNITHEMAVRATAAGLKIEGMILIHSYFGKEVVEGGERKWFHDFWRFVSEEGVEDLKNNPMRDGGGGDEGGGLSESDGLRGGERFVEGERGRVFRGAEGGQRVGRGIGVCGDGGGGARVSSQ